MRFKYIFPFTHIPEPDIKTGWIFCLFTKLHQAVMFRNVSKIKNGLRKYVISLA